MGARDTAGETEAVAGVGLLIPAGNTVMEGDFHRQLDGRWRVHTSRMMLEEVTLAGEQRMLDEEAEPAARRLRQTKPAVVAFGCTSASSLQGEAYDRELRERLAEAAGAPVLGVLSSAIDLLAGAGPVAVFTPYVPELSEAVAASLTAGGVQVAQVSSLGISDIGGIGAVTPGQIVDHVKSMDLTGVDALFCSCTNLRAFEARDELLALTGLNVVTSNHAMVEAVRAHVSGSPLPSGAGPA